MKKTAFRKLQDIVYFLTILLSFAITSCDKEEAIRNNENLVVDNLKGTWHPSYVSLDDNDVSGDFLSFNISIDKNLNYTSNGGDLSRQPNPWPASGSFTLQQPVKDPSLISLIRSDGVVITVKLEADSIAQFNFVFDADSQGSNGRTRAIEGEWVFVF